MDSKKSGFLFLINFFVAISLIAGSNDKKMLDSWPKGITYEIFVMSFSDSNADSIGDIKGMTSKLDYLSELGIEAVWLMPVSPSPSYHKYDVTDYYGIDPQYGTMSDFKDFLQKAHQKNIKVVIDMVINHTSATHPWFLAAKNDKNSPYRNYYVWSADTHLINKEPNNWHKVPGQEEKYYGMFWSGMPDLNYDNPAVREEMKKVGRFWLQEIGVDGLRLDAARHIYPNDEAEKSHAWWIEYRKAMEAVKKDVYMVGEVAANDTVVAPFFKGLPANFNFDLAQYITKSVKTGKDTFLIRNLLKIHTLYREANPAFNDATFLSNHDQNRIASELDGDISKIKLAASILFTLPGSPYLYYGEEIGMLGMKPDENIREPFLWQEDAKDYTRAKWIKPAYTTTKSVPPLSIQEKDPASVYNHYKKLIALRRNSETLTLGSVESVKNTNRNLLVFRRRHNGKSLLVIHNLGSKAQLLDKQLLKGEIIYNSSGGSPVNINAIRPYTTYIIAEK